MKDIEIFNMPTSSIALISSTTTSVNSTLSIILTTIIYSTTPSYHYKYTGKYKL